MIYRLCHPSKLHSCNLHNMQVPAFHICITCCLAHLSSWLLCWLLVSIPSCLWVLNSPSRRPSTTARTLWRWLLSTLCCAASQAVLASVRACSKEDSSTSNKWMPHTCATWNMPFCCCSCTMAVTKPWLSQLLTTVLISMRFEPSTAALSPMWMHNASSTRVSKSGALDYASLIWLLKANTVPDSVSDMSLVGCKFCLRMSSMTQLSTLWTVILNSKVFQGR